MATTSSVRRLSSCPLHYSLDHKARCTPSPPPFSPPPPPYHHHRHVIVPCTMTSLKVTSLFKRKTRSSKEHHGSPLAFCIAILSQKSYSRKLADWTKCLQLRVGQVVSERTSGFNGLANLPARSKQSFETGSWSNCHNLPSLCWAKPP